MHEVVDNVCRKASTSMSISVHLKQGVALMGCNTTGPPCSVVVEL